MTNSKEALEKFYCDLQEYEDRFSEIRKQQVQASAELFKRQISDKELESQIAEMFAVHGQKNPNKPRSKNIHK